MLLTRVQALFSAKAHLKGLSLLFYNYSPYGPLFMLFFSLSFGIYEIVHMIDFLLIMFIICSKYATVLYVPILLFGFTKYFMSFWQIVLCWYSFRIHIIKAMLHTPIWGSRDPMFHFGESGALTPTKFYNPRFDPNHVKTPRYHYRLAMTSHRVKNFGQYFLMYLYQDRNYCISGYFKLLSNY